MQKYMKLFSMVLVFLIGLVCVTGVVNAASNNYDIKSVEVNGAEITGTTSVYAERGEDVEVEVRILGTGDVEDVTIKAWIGGYEYGDVEDKTDMFDVVNGVTYVKELSLSVPDDIDGTEDYTLHVEVYDDDDEEEQSYNLDLWVEESRHKLEIQDIIFRPSATVNAGRPLFATVRVKNVGDKKEEDLKVTISIPELGISTRDYIDELVSVEDDDDDEETSQSSDELYLTIPEDAETGEYDVEVSVEYNKGHDVVSKKETISVVGVEKKAETKAVISIDTTTQKIAQGEEKAYKLMFANLGEQKEIYSVEVAGVETWAGSRVEPAFLAVDADSTGELYVYLKAKEDAVVGTHILTVKIMSGTDVVKEVNLNAEVTAKEATVSGLKTGLQIGFAVLVVLLIILVIIVAFRRIGGGSLEEEEKPLESNTAEGQTYY